MTGGLMQLVACGAQDVFLTGSPMISYFKVVYRRHTNFATETIRQKFDTAVDFGSKVSCTLTRNGDLITGAYIQASLPDLSDKQLTNFSLTANGVNHPGRRYMRWVDNIGHYLLKSVEISIGSNVIDKHYSDWFEIWAQLTVPAGKMAGYRKLIGQDPKNVFGQNTGLQADVVTSTSLNTVNNKIVGRDIFIPLQFWFCRNVGVALPLVALQYNDVKIVVEFQTAERLVQVWAGDVAQPDGSSVGWINNIDFNSYVTVHNTFDASLWVDYVFLDADERRRFAQVSHEYLIEQVQFNTDICFADKSHTMNLVFNHTVKELIWVMRATNINKSYSNYTDTLLPNVPPFQTLAVSPTTGDITTGLTGLPHETNIATDLLTISIISSDTITGKISETTTGITTFNVTPTIPGYLMYNGDVITLNSAVTDADVDNITLVVTTSVGGVAKSFLTNDAIIAGKNYNKVISIVRMGATITPDKLSLTVRFPEIIPAYSQITPVSISHTDEYQMTIGDIIQITPATDLEDIITLTVVTVSNGTATSFMVREAIPGAPKTYNTVISIVRPPSGALYEYIDPTTLQVALTSSTDIIFNPDPAVAEIVISNETASMTEFTVTGINMEIDDVVTISSTGGSDTLQLRIKTVNADGTPKSFTLLSSMYADVVYNTVVSIIRQLLQVRLEISYAVNDIDANNATIFSVYLVSSYGIPLQIGDIVMVQNSQGTATTVGLRVKEVDTDGKPTVFTISGDMTLDVLYDKVISIERPSNELDGLGQITTLPTGLSAIKTYNDLMKFSNYNSVRPYSSINGTAGNPVKSAMLVLNNQERFLERPGRYFSLVQPFNHHTNIPESPGINVYSFALKPEEYQPSGTCNFSRLETAKLKLTVNPLYQDEEERLNYPMEILVFAVNYNILRIVGGMGGLAYN
jgi:hypothetical protein